MRKMGHIVIIAEDGETVRVPVEITDWESLWYSAKRIAEAFRSNILTLEGSGKVETWIRISDRTWSVLIPA